MNVEKFNELIESLSNKTELDLSNKPLTQIQIHTLAEIFKTNTSLIKVNLSRKWAFINDTRLTPIINALKVNKTIKSADLSFNDLDDVDAIELAEMLKSNNTLTSLYIGHNIIKTGGFTAIAAALASNITLNHINFALTSMDNGGIKALINSMQKNYVLISLEGIIGNEVLLKILNLLLTYNKALLNAAWANILDYYDANYMQKDTELEENLRPNKKVKENILVSNPITSKDLFMLSTHEEFFKTNLEGIKDLTTHEPLIPFDHLKKVIYKDYVQKNLHKIKGWCKSDTNLGDLNILPKEIQHYIFSFLENDYLFPKPIEGVNKVDMSHFPYHIKLECNEIYISDSESSNLSGKDSSDNGE